MTLDIRVKRIYDPPDENDGLRLLADRLWPRGVSKEKARVDLWPKELAPSNELRQWLHADPSRFQEFVLRYQAELAEQRGHAAEILAGIADSRITLLTATKDPVQGHVGVLRDFLESLGSSRGRHSRERR